MADEHSMSAWQAVGCLVGLVLALGLYGLLMWFGADGLTWRRKGDDE